MHMKTGMHRRGVTGVGLVVVAVLTGCSMPNSSNPTLSISEARVVGDTAELRLQIDNPSDMDIRVESADWSLLYGPLPVADGSWDLGFELPSGGAHQFDRSIRFSSPPLDPSAGEIELSGTLDVGTVGNDGNTALHGAGFAVSKKITR